MPMQIDGTQEHIVVERGWIARDVTDRTKVPLLTTPKGVIEIEGLIKRDAGHVLQLGSAPTVAPGAILQNVTPAELASVSQLSMLPYVLEQHSELADNLVRDWPRPSLGIDKHRGYAFQWYGLSLTALLFFLVTGWRRGSK
jgi:cytochrome oxidase assembly protein ShyY1